MLEAQGIEHQILNAKNHEIEAQIVAQAGQKGRVTVATNMAGRGTDIKLGDGVAELGGLHVIGTERHEARRIDRQLAGRCARQGDPGLAQFFISLDDEIVEAFGEKPAARIRKRLHGSGELTSVADATDVRRRPAEEGTPALPRSQAADALREAAGRDAQEHGAQPGAGLSGRSVETHFPLRSCSLRVAIDFLVERLERAELVLGDLEPLGRVRQRRNLVEIGVKLRELLANLA